MAHQKVPKQGREDIRVKGNIIIKPDPSSSQQSKRCRNEVDIVNL